jgi:phage repressor protein C with HTH and peptisase S24 domain
MAIEHSGLKKAEIARRMGVHPNRITPLTKTTKDSRFSPALAKVTGVNLNWLVSGEGSMLDKEPVQTNTETLKSVPLVNWENGEELADALLAGHDQVVTYAAEAFDLDYAHAPDSAGEQAFGMMMEGISMEAPPGVYPSLQRGAILIFDPSADQGTNDFGLVKVADASEWIVRKVIREPNGKYSLVATNPSFPTLTNIEVEHIIWMIGGYLPLI